jgi:purine-binding chemotaxis protein CheW
MTQTPDIKTKKRPVELATFYAGGACYGMDILNVQGINKLFEITPVPQAPDYVRGILNLRGQIITIIDLGKKVGISSTELSDTSRNIIVDSRGEQIGFLVERIGDIIQADWNDVEPPPANMGNVQGKFFKGVLKTEDTLIGILDVEEALK